jgi:hypothetical protein
MRTILKKKYLSRVLRLPSQVVFLLWALICITFTSCSDDDSTAKQTSYVVVMRTASGEDVMQVREELETDISAEPAGLAQSGWCYYAATGNSYLSFQYETGEILGYDVLNSTLTEKGSMDFDRADCFGVADENTLLVASGPWGDLSEDVVLQLLDASSVSMTKSVTTPLYALGPDDDVNQWPTSMVVRDDKLFISFFPTVGTTWETPLTDTAYVSVYSYPGLEYISTLKDVRTGPIGYYGSSPALLQTENGDIYTLSSSSFAAGYTQATRPSGILRIKKGETEFDESYFFNVEELSGYKILTAGYVDKGKAVARVVPDESPDNLNDAFDVTAPLCKLVVIDLINQTVEDVQMKTNGVDEEASLHGGQYATPFFVEKGKVWVSVNTGIESYLYLVDPATATAERKAKILGTEIQAIYEVSR